MYVESNFGTAESVVDGLTIPDSMVIERTTGTVIDRRVAAKTMMTSVTPGRSGSSTLPIPKDLADASVLTKADAVDLVQLGRRVEQVFGAPQDIEWAIDSDRLWVIQARPITQRVNGSISDAQQL
jgi:phosphoenolpyruvate synthase/pyruvate phosphate dikinase